MRVAWLRRRLRFKLETLDQICRRVNQWTYRYRSAAGSFTADLRVNPAGFVTLWPGFADAVGK